MGKGYIKLHRELQDCWVWKGEKFSRGQAWVDLLMSANHKDVKIPFGEKIEIIKRGQLITSISKLSDKWGWSFNTTKKFLKLLENDNMLTRKSDNTKTLITIVNYEVYQSDERENIDELDRPVDRPLDRPTDEQGANPITDSITNPLIPNNNVKNDKECKKNDKENIYCANFEAFWKIYPNKKDKARAYKCYKARVRSGFSEKELLEAAKNYAEECEKENREKRFIKYGSTFLSDSTPFVDYLKGGETDGKHKDPDAEHAKWVEEHREQLEAVRRDMSALRGELLDSGQGNEHSDSV